TFGSDLKWHPHIHLIVTGGGLSVNGKLWLNTGPKYLMNHNGLKKRWGYQVITR
ncbi:MAG: IS91 family transposase, partial [Candidatus Aminicenantes bacterium]|nr:IS91 family transposase [Candidatus Aminicenantes bacterium]